MTEQEEQDPSDWFMYPTILAELPPLADYYVKVWSWSCPDPKCFMKFKVGGPAKSAVEESVLAHIFGVHKYNQTPVYLRYRMKE